MTSGARRGLLFLLVLGVLVNGGAYYLSARSVDTLRTEQQASCRFDADIGGAPVASQKGVKPSLLGVSIVSDARVAWHGLHCPGRLQAADPSFVKWAKHYRLPYQ